MNIDASYMDFARINSVTPNDRPDKLCTSGATQPSQSENFAFMELK